VHDFGAPEPVEEGPPPPPMFSEEELAAAKAASFEQGRTAGRGEADASREKYVAGVMAQIGQKAEQIFAAENEREAKFESEVVALTASIFQKLFPGLNERQGLAEIERIISDVLESQQQQPELIIEVTPDDVDDVKAHVANMARGLHGKGACLVQPNPALGKGDCRMFWNDGGAIRDIAGLTAQIAARLDETLEGRPRLRDNEQITESPPEG
jgi:flagellar assembly protein FliH